MASSLAENPQLVKDGKRSVRIRGLTSLASYPRQRLKKQNPNGKTMTVIPLNGFLKDIRSGIGVVSRNAEQQILETVTEHSYRKTEAIVEKTLAKETIRREVLKTGEKAKALPASRKQERMISERNLKDAADPTTSYRKSAGSAIRQKLGSLCRWRRMYVLIDGVHVFLKDKGRECKVGAIVRQQSEKISEAAAWCAWGRIQAFRALTAAACSVIALSLGCQVVIVSDGAKWIRNMRKWIACLSQAIWILDWFHLKDNLLKCLVAFNLEEASETAQRLLSLLWRGRAEEAARLITALPGSVMPETRSAEDAAVKAFLAYMDNQREGIIDYEAYQRQGYIVGSGFVEKLNDTLIKNRMVRGKRMRWSLKGGEAMMALLSARHNGRLAEVFA